MRLKFKQYDRIVTGDETMMYLGAEIHPEMEVDLPEYLRRTYLYAEVDDEQD